MYPLFQSHKTCNCCNLFVQFMCFHDKNIIWACCFAIWGEKRHLQQYLIWTPGRNKLLLPNDKYTELNLLSATLQGNYSLKCFHIGSTYKTPNCPRQLVYFFSIYWSHILTMALLLVVSSPSSYWMSASAQAAGVLCITSYYLLPPIHSIITYHSW